MLDEIPALDRQYDLYRFVAQPEVERIIQEDALGIEDSKNMLALVRQHNSEETKALLDDPFDLDHRSKSRYSDGTFSVFYASLEVETARTEVQHWLMVRLRAGAKPLPTTNYLMFRCSFRGKVKDLREMEDSWPDLVHEDDYEFCNRLGIEASKAGLDALVVPSARHKGGTNVPVFVRNSLCSPVRRQFVKFATDPDSDDVQVYDFMDED